MGLSATELRQQAAKAQDQPVTAEPDGPATPMDYGDCGPDARREPGLQGQVPRRAQEDGSSARGWHCNLRRVGQSDLRLRGNNFQLAWMRDCAYVLKSTSGTKSSHEALEVHEGRGLLLATQGGLFAQYLEVYDVKDDCAHPKFLARYDAGLPLLHGLRISSDGRTAYSTDTVGFAAGQVLHAIDITDSRAPRRKLTWDPVTEGIGFTAVHDLDTDASGDRLYLGAVGATGPIGWFAAGPQQLGAPSLAILNSSELQAGEPGAKLRTISTLALPNFGHTVQRIRVAGKPYLVVSGESPAGGPQECPWAWGHIVDISDERRPRRVSDLRLQVNQRRHCASTMQDGAANYSIHYVGVDDEQNTRYAPSAVLDNTASVVRYRPETGALWMVSINSGFQVLQLTGKLAEQELRVTRARTTARRALRSGHVRAAARCAQPCAGTLELRVGGRRVSRRPVALGRSGAATRAPLSPKPPGACCAAVPLRGCRSCSPPWTA